MTNEVEIEGVGAVIYNVNHDRLKDVLEATLHVLQGAYYTNEEGKTNISDQVLSVFAPFWGLVYYSDRPKDSFEGTCCIEEFNIDKVGVIILETTDKKFRWAMEGIFKPLVEAFKKGTEWVSLEMLDRLQQEAIVIVVDQGTEGSTPRE